MRFLKQRCGKASIFVKGTVTCDFFGLCIFPRIKSTLQSPAAETSTDYILGQAKKFEYEPPHSYVHVKNGEKSAWNSSACFRSTGREK